MEEIDLKRFAKLAWAKKFYIILVMIATISIGVCYSYVYVVPKYQSVTTLLLANIRDEVKDNTVKQSDIADFSMTSTLLEPYISIVKSKKVLNRVISNLQLNMSEGYLKSIISVKEVNAAMISITVINENPDLAEKITNEVAKVFVDEAKELFNIDNVNIIDKAERAEGPCNINHVKDVTMFTILGAFLSVGLVFIIYILDTTIKESEDIEQELGLPVLGRIPVFEKRLEKNIKVEGEEKDVKPKESEIVILDNTKSPVAEAFRALRTNVMFAPNIKTILVTSSRMSEGKSYVTANLAATIAKTDKKVIIVDADMRKGRQNKIFKTDNKKGLSNYLARCEETKVDIRLLASYIKTTSVPNLHLITSGSRPSNPAELLSPAKIKGLVSVLSEIYDIVIIDGTPSSIIADSVAISKYVDYTMLVTAHKYTKIEDAKRVIKSFEQIGVGLNGAVLNKYPLTKEGYTSSYYYNDAKRESKLDSKNAHTEIRTIEDFLDEANISLNTFRYIDANEINATNNVGVNPSFNKLNLTVNKSFSGGKSFTPAVAEGDSKIELRIEKIDNEITILKNMLMQIAMNTSQVTSKDVELIRYDISNLKESIEEIKENDEIKQLKKEIDEIKDFTENLVDSQKDNNEKIKKFIENYYSQISERTKGNKEE